MHQFVGSASRAAAVTFLGVFAWVAVADVSCPTCGDPAFPEASAFLAKNGLPPESYEVLLAWTEVSPSSSARTVAGYHVAPHDGSTAPFDLYADVGGQILSDDEVAALGIVPKQWNLTPQTTDAEVYAGPENPEAPVPLPGSPSAKKALPLVALPTPDVSLWHAQDAESETTSAKGVKRIGAFLELDEPVTLAGRQTKQGAWRALQDGTSFWAVRLQAPGAIGQRVHFAEFAIPLGANVLVYNAADPGERYVVDGPAPAWSPTCFADEVVVECQVPLGASIDEVGLAIDRTVFVYAGPGEWNWAKAAGSCNLDVSCFPAWSSVANGVGGIGSIGDTGFLWCTGTLIVDSDPTTSVPYFLTAQHCVSNTSEANSVEVYWLYQTSSCNGAAPSPVSVPRTTGGAQFLAGASATGANDFALLRLRNTPPAGVTFVGWNSDPVANGTGLTAIHHPSGDYKRISFGTVDQSVLSDFVARPATNYWGVRWSSGITEPGSSGSPLFESSSQRIIGQLWGGFSSCSYLDGPDAYGRFDKTFPLVQQYLGESLRVTSPNGGEAWEVGTSQVITWVPAVAQAGSTVRIELLMGGLIAEVLATSTANDGGFDWTVPAETVPGDTYRIRVASTTNTALIDESDADFSLVPKPKLSVSAPQDGNVWPRGALRPIQWESVGNVGGTVKIELLSGGQVVLVISPSTVNDGTYEWTMPGEQALGTFYSVRVSSTSNAAVSATSPGVFSVTSDPVVVLTSPNGGETLKLGTTQNIQWTSANAGGSVRIELVKGGKVLRVISANESNDGAYQWPIPEDLAPDVDYRIRIASTLALAAYDESNVDFTLIVAPQFHVVSPNGGERWAQGSQQEVTWTSAGDVGDAVAVELRSNGIAILTLAASTSNDGSLLVDVPVTLALGSAYTVRVVSRSNPTVYDDSNAAFSVTNDPVLKVVAPNGGETWQSTGVQNIRWSSRGLAGNLVALELLRSTSSGQVVLTIAASTANNGLFAWTMPDDISAGTDYYVRVRSLSVEGLQDQSDGFFAISTCAPAAPKGISASDGTYAAFVRVSWLSIAGVTGYRVYRSATNDSAAATPITGWLSGTSYEDASAGLQGGAGCSGGTGAGVTYFYWVQAANTCGESVLSDSDSGYRGSGKKARVYAKVLPSTMLADGTQEAHTDSTLAIRLRSAEELDPSSLWGSVVTSAGVDEAIDWIPASEDSLTDGWAVYHPKTAWSTGEVVTMTVGISTSAGTTLSPITYTFTVTAEDAPRTAPLWQPDFNALADTGLAILADDATNETMLLPVDGTTLPEFRMGAAQTYRVEPDTVYAGAKRVWLPLPEHLTSSDVVLYYLHTDGDTSSWYRGDQVDGWEIGGGIPATFDGVRYVGYLVRHGGTLSLAVADSSEPTGASMAPSLPFTRETLGDTLMLLLAMVVLVIAGRRATGLRTSKDHDRRVKG